MPGFELIGAEERREIDEVLSSGILMRYGFDGQRNGMWKSRELEQALCARFQVEHAHLTSSGTAALTTAMAALGIGAGDEVIVPVFTFVASFEALLSVGATPVFVDVDDTLTLAPEAVRAAITPRTRAVMPVHMCGGMADMDALQDICAEHGLLLLEDACQAIGGSYRGRALGTLGDAGALSFDFVKTITCGEGGVVLTNDAEVYRRCDAFADHGHDHLGADRGADDHPWLGYNFRISELHAAIGLAQLRKLDGILATQHGHKKVLKEALSGVKGVSFRRLPDPAGDNAAFLSFFLPSEEIARAVAAGLKAAAVPAFHWYDNNWHYVRKWQHLRQVTTTHRLPPELERAIRARLADGFPASDAVMSRCLSTPIGLLWSANELGARADTLVRTVAGAL